MQFRRLRKTQTIRNLVRETTLTSDDFIQPFFIVEGKNKREAIDSMPGIYRYSIDLLLKSIEKYQKAGGKAGLFFGLPKKKNLLASEAYTPNGIVQKAIKAVKKEFPHFIIITDVCLCAYTTHGHCGVIQNNYVDNDKTLPLLTKMAVSHAEAGADIVAPSDMMDFRVARIREGLDKNKFNGIGIMSYAVKYASAFYGPFRDAAQSGAQFGGRKTYQMDYANQREALKEARQDVMEGADFIMVKPALSYLDIISLLKKELTAPIVAYSVSGEYSMIKAAAQKKWIDERDIVLEILTSIKRAGADIIITYYAQQVLKWLKS
ncbi:Porphobilinogen synthase [hydrothermal vent metagenome]|uniref:Delta-aminolevulinic acid dehydratase n=1 Tax=hydrothermal vent metagenome TaxID=652676 RepID=A0A3B1DMU3_9ZZZZ